MKSRSQAFYGYQATYDANHATGTVTETSARPLSTTESLTVFADSKGNFEGMNTHEYRKTIFHEYEGGYFKEKPSQFYRVTGTGALRSFGNYVDAVSQAETIHLYNMALEDGYEKLRSGEAGSGLDLSVSAAEIHQVKHLVGSMPKLLSFWNRLAKGKDGKPIGLRTAEDWLSIQYGLKPLLEEAYGLFDAVMHRRTYSFQRVVGKSKLRQRSSKRFSVPLQSVFTEYVDRDFSQRGRVVMEYKVKQTWRTLLAGYTSLNPISIAWELVPYSFVADWFINVGGYLRTMETAVLYGQDFVRGCYTFTLKDRQNGWISGSGMANGYYWNGSGGAEIEQSYKRRTPFTSHPLPYLPRFRCDLGSRQLISAASLLRVLMRK